MGRPQVSINEKVWRKYYETEDKRFDEAKINAEKKIFNLTVEVFERYKQEWLKEVESRPSTPTEWMAEPFNPSDPRYSWNQDEFHSKLDWT